ncbi:potassium channel family protein [Salidesulfovibrio brasiliensis]|uniref:potassium channel family protein n=1 Tax=Salidesulfovibrio brasiliensis TaxID=221711 RepID=UPI0006CFFC19|nr:TrkA family potassium uptake protein [Salidesulfovibrio brasiliensis]
MAGKIDIGIIGLGKFGGSLASALHDLGQDLIGIDRNERNVRDFRNEIPQVYQADGTDITALEQLGFNELDHVIVSIGGSMEASILVVLNLQELGVGKIWVKAVSPQHEKVLQRLGVDFVVFPEKFVAKQVAHRLLVPGIMDYLGLGEDVITREVAVEVWKGKTLSDLDLTNRHQVQVIAIKYVGDEEFSFVPDPHKPLNEGDTIVLLGKAENVLKLRNN